MREIVNVSRLLLVTVRCTRLINLVRWDLWGRLMISSMRSVRLIMMRLVRSERLISESWYEQDEDCEVHQDYDDEKISGRVSAPEIDWLMKINYNWIWLQPQHSASPSHAPQLETMFTIPLLSYHYHLPTFQLRSGKLRVQETSTWAADEKALVSSEPEHLLKRYTVGVIHYYDKMLRGRYNSN